MEQQPKPLTAHDAAKDFIRTHLEAGYTLQTFLRTHPSSWSMDKPYKATIGGTLWQGRGEERTWHRLEIDQIGVQDIAATQEVQVFPLRAVYQEVWQELHPDELPGELMTTKPLF